jgi:hypothetical protein
MANHEEDASVMYDTQGVFDRPHAAQKMAVQQSLMDIFEEFTVMISGELKQVDSQKFGEPGHFNIRA